MRPLDGIFSPRYRVFGVHVCQKARYLNISCIAKSVRFLTNSIFHISWAVKVGRTPLSSGDQLWGPRVTSTNVFTTNHVRVSPGNNTAAALISKGLSCFVFFFSLQGCTWQRGGPGVKPDLAAGMCHIDRPKIAARRISEPASTVTATYS